MSTRSRVVAIGGLTALAAGLLNTARSIAAGRTLTSITVTSAVAVGLLVTAPAASAACGTATYSGGDGTSGDPYQISSAADLVTLRDTPADFGCYFIQTASIDLSAVAQWNTGIGTSSANAFSGNFNGNGYRITGLTITNSQVDFIGLFGYVDNGTIRNVEFVGDVTGRAAVGGLIGTFRAASSASVQTSSFMGTVTGTTTVGGLIGQITVASGTAVIDRSHSAGDVQATAGRSGGLVGSMSSGGSATVQDSYSTSTVRGTTDVGGLIGRTSGLTSIFVRDSYASGAVSGGTSNGGLIGDLNNTSPGNITDSYWDTQTSGQPTSGAGTGKTTVEMTALATFSAWSISPGYNASSTWGICSGVNNGYPFLTAFYTSDPCSGGGGGSDVASPQPTYTFTFLTSGGGKCLPDVTVTRLERFTLPPASVACTPLGTSLAGWSIPGQDWAFAPGRVVTVVDSQIFTAVARNPEITITYDSNVNMGVECLANNQNITREEDRWQTVDTPRVGPTASLGTSAPCSPPGFVLIGWTDANTPEGSGQAQQGAQTFEPGAAIPDSWNLKTTNPVNSIRLYALWGRTTA